MILREALWIPWELLCHSNFIKPYSEQHVCQPSFTCILNCLFTDYCLFSCEHRMNVCTFSHAEVLIYYYYYYYPNLLPTFYRELISPLEFQIIISRYAKTRRISCAIAIWHLMFCIRRRPIPQKFIFMMWKSLCNAYSLYSIEHSALSLSHGVISPFITVFFSPPFHPVPVILWIGWFTIRIRDIARPIWL